MLLLRSDPASFATAIFSLQLQARLHPIKSLAHPGDLHINYILFGRYN